MENTTRRRRPDREKPRVRRLSPIELMYLRVESAAWPYHFGGLAILEAGPLLDGSGRLRLEEIRDRLDRRVARVPQLRRRVHFPGSLEGRALWVDDRRFAIEHHVQEAAVPPPGGDAELLEAAARIYERLLDRRRPLWELWFLTGLSDGRVGVLLKLHHSVTDGMGAVAVMASLFHSEPNAPDPQPIAWAPESIPERRTLVADSLSTKIASLRRAAEMLAHPARLVAEARTVAQVAFRILGQKGAPRTSLNRRVGSGRRIRFLRVDLATMKEVAHAHGGKVNDVVLDLWAGGLRELLASRGENTQSLELTSGVAVSLRSARDDTVDNQAGTITVPLPVWEDDAARRLELIARRTRTIKSEQPPAAITRALVALAATPVGGHFMTRQRATNVIATNLMGPPAPVYVLGAPILDVLPIMGPIGNIGVSLCAFSYVGRICLVVTADAGNFPDLEVLMTGMGRDWHELVRAGRAMTLSPYRTAGRGRESARQSERRVDA